MGVPIENNDKYSLLFVDDKVIIAGDEHERNCWRSKNRTLATFRNCKIASYSFILVSWTFTCIFTLHGFFLHFLSLKVAWDLISFPYPLIIPSISILPSTEFVALVCGIHEVDFVRCVSNGNLLVFPEFFFLSRDSIVCKVALKEMLTYIIRRKLHCFRHSFCSCLIVVWGKGIVRLCH